MRKYRAELREVYLDKLFLMRKVRFVAALCIASWGLILWFFGIPGFNPKMFFLFAFCAMVINQPYQFIIKRAKSLDLILEAHQVIDVVLVTLCIFFMGGVDAYFAIIIYSLIIIFAGVNVSIKNSFLIASLCCLSYLIMFSLEYFDVIPTMPIFNFHLNPPLNFIVPIFICLSLFLIAYVSSFLAKIIIQKSEQSESSMEKLKKAENAMMQAEKLAVVGQFATGIVHEIKNPLGIIISGIEFLEKEVADRADLILSVNRIKQSALHASEIIKDLLNFSRPSEQSLEVLDLHDVLSDNIKLLKELKSDSELRIIKDFSRKPIMVRVNASQFEQVFFNIAVNAHDAMPSGGRIFVKTYIQEYNQKGAQSGFRKSSQFVVGERTAVLEVRDEGKGIAAEHISKIYDPFFTTKHKKDNAGLGLSICQRIIDAHKGELEIKSLRGKGTIVIIKLPVFQEKKEKSIFPYHDI
ncbi:sensor histidine kinase [Candidatus Omnitrophota bacterium]